ncbi:chitinase [Colletotrichum higginsianum]|uniref:Chitinase n=1 Tax=Colletotrichum higginsianum (strain IMI 349063) TaxID=759273 RepID=H1V5W2_COLHI|nr:chitinase [Colletotrichum higginsianum]
MKDLIRDSLSKFTRNFNGVYRMRARGVAACDVDLVQGGSVAYEWWVDNEAYCCKSPKAVIVPCSDNDPFGGNQNKEFQLLMEKHIENPTCPATILRPVLGDMFTNVKGSLEFEASLTRTLQGKTTNCEMDRYWIGPTPGVAGGNDIYRDPYMANGGPQDRWVVFHMHIDEGTQWLRTINGRTHVGIRSVQVFHGYESNSRWFNL